MSEATDEALADVQAILALSEPEAVARTVAAAPAERRADLVRALRGRVDELVRTQREAALPASERLLAAADALPADLASELETLVQRGRAIALHANSQSAAALPHYERALAAHERRGETLEAARVLRSLVDVRQMAGDAEGALVAADRCRGLLEGTGADALAAQLETNVGNVHFRLDRFPEARAAYERALQSFEAAGDAFGAAHARCNLANVETNAHRFERARELFESARAAFESAGHAVYALDCAFGLAYLEFRAGEFAAAIEGLEAVRDAYAALGAKPSGAPLSDLDLAEVHLRLGAFADAERSATRARDGFDALGMDYEGAKARLFLGVAIAGRDPRAAAAALAEAEARFARLGNRTRAALVTLQRTLLPARIAPTLAEVERAADVLAASGDHLLVHAGELARARALAAAGDHAEAQARAEALLAEIDRDRTPLERALAIELHRLLADVVREVAPDEAEGELRRAILDIEVLYAGLAWADARLVFFGRGADAYLELATLLLERDGADGAAEALSLMEAGRQRRLDEAPIADLDGVAAPLRRRVDSLLAHSMRAAIRRADGPDAARAAAATYDTELGEALDAYALERSRAARRPSPAAGRAYEAPYAFAARADARLLRYLVRGEDVWRVDQAPGATPRPERCPIPASRLAHLGDVLRFQAEKLRHGGAYLERHGAAVERSVRRALEELGAGLFRGLEGGDDALLLVPNGPLHGLPLHAALVAGVPLFARREVSYARGAREHARAVERSSDRRGAAVLIAADPGPGLPSIEGEVAALRAAWGASGVEVDAAELLRRLRAGGERPAAVHVAAHGAHRPDHPLFSGLLVGTSVVTALDLAALDLAGAIVTLSGCETARLAIDLGEDLAGPERALLGAGAGAVVGSLASVEDAAAARFMAHLHASLASGATVRTAYTRALREAFEDARGISSAASWVLVGNAAARVGSIA